MSSSKLKIFYATPDDIGSIGALRSMDLPTLKYLSDFECNLTWLGININNHDIENFKGEVISFNSSLFQKISKRIVNKIFRQLGFQSGEDQKINQQERFDKWLSSILESRKEDIDENFIFIGRSVSSLRAFQVVRKYGGHTILHSQWIHPISHKKILLDEFTNIGIKYNPIPKRRTNIQLKEIELSSKVWCNSNLIFDSFIKNNIPKEKLFFNSLGVDTNVFKPKKLVNSDASDIFTIIFVGNINIEKGIHVLLESMMDTIIPECRLILNGALPEYFYKKFNLLINELKKKKNIEIIIESGCPIKNFQRSDLFVLPSLHESFGLVVLEAMACRLPVIVTDQVGAKDHVIDNNNGFIVKSGSVAELSEKIMNLYKNPILRKKFADNSYEISKKLDWKQVTYNFKNSLEKILHE